MIIKRNSMFNVPIFNYRIFIWVLLILAILMGGVFLLIAFSYKLQKTTEAYIESARTAVNEAKEMENELTAIKGLTYTYLVNKSDRWLDSLKHRKASFTIHLERARIGASNDAEKLLLQQISALFSNYEQNVLLAITHLKNNEVSTANALLLHSVQDLLGTIQQKSNEFMSINMRAEVQLEKELAQTNSIILKILITLGIGGITIGLLFGWLISRLLFSPINQLILTVRSASGEAVLEKVRLKSGNDINELGERIKKLIDRINKANEDLSRNMELLQHSNKHAALGKIAPTIAHEIRNPLAAIKMLVYSIKEEGGVSSTVKDDLEIISTEIDRLEKFTKDFLRFAKPSDPVFESVNPVTSLLEVIHLLKPRLKANNITVKEEIEGIDCSVMADSAQLKQIYLNIILNSIDVMSSGGTLTINGEFVTAIQSSDGGGFGTFVGIRFDDTGPGIPNAILNKLFEPYIKKSDMGVGIGLAISQSIAKSHAGWITAENKPNGKGAIFSVFLPIQNTN
jgi:two-component system, NtrC family, sensor histidine kinase HydH